MLHGAPGVGKSTFAAGAPGALFIDPEKRTDHLDVDRLQPETWPELLEMVQQVHAEKACTTLVFSTIDFMEGMIWKHLCKSTGAASIDDVNGGYGKGYVAAADEFKKFGNGLEALRQAGITTVLEAHSLVREFKNPAGENYDVWSVKLHQKAKSVLIERCDAVGFVTFEDLGFKKKGELKAKAVTTGERVLKFGHNPAFETKAGFPLPDSMPLTWAAWAAAVEAAS
jgi:hypothetical protein